MFGPNVVADGTGACYHHREPAFHRLLDSLEREMAERFGLDDYRFLFVAGSGTTANEAVIHSWRHRFRYLFADAEFGVRLRRIGEAHPRPVPQPKERFVAYPYYETSISRVNRWTQPDETEACLVDMVSAFPYYRPPAGTAVWTTVSSKQLGAYPVVGIIAVHRAADIDAYVHESPAQGSALSLSSYLRFAARHETPTTPPIFLLRDLLERLQRLDPAELRTRIDRRRRIIEQLVPPEAMVGEGPVVTLKPLPPITAIAAAFRLYRGAYGHQIFLWSGTDADYEMLYDSLEKCHAKP